MQKQLLLFFYTIGMFQEKHWHLVMCLQPHYSPPKKFYENPIHL